MKAGNMKVFTVAMLMVFFMAGPASGEATTGEEAALERVIRKLETEEREAVLRGDLQALETLWAADFTVNSPQNRISSSSAEVLDLVRSGVIRYSSFAREIEALRFYGDTVIVMGQEVVTPVGNAPNAGESVRRRFTNIWIKQGDQWRLAARHANAICQP